jgi:hypothetical protein
MKNAVAALAAAAFFSTGRLGADHPLPEAPREQIGSPIAQRGKSFPLGAELSNPAVADAGPDPTLAQDRAG